MRKDFLYAEQFNHTDDCMWMNGSEPKERR
jgi:hypothetical protein